jgi:hypothetical protein
MIKKAREKEFNDPRGGIFTFLVIQIMEVPELINDERVHYITFLVDWSVYLSELNFQLQAENQLVQQKYSHVKTFQA